MADDRKTGDDPKVPGKAHGDAYPAAAGDRKPTAQDAPKAGDSPKRQGDPLAETLRTVKKD